MHARHLHVHNPISNDNTCINANTYTFEEKEMKSSTLRSKYIEQLKELYQLFESTAITREEYEEQKLTILNKMKEL